MWKKYNPFEQEKFWQDFWEKNNIYDFDFKKNKSDSYTIDTPPPTISWKLHIGHIFSYTQTEVIARYKRMKWYNVFYPFGFDTNWLPTEKLVEKENKIKSKQISRNEFVEKCLNTIEKYISDFWTLRKSVWISADLNNPYSTIQPEIQKISQKRFLEMVNNWQIYKKKFPALRSTTFQTSIAQAEVEDKEMESIFYQIKFTTENWNILKIATTRPELLPACVAVFVHPNDERYKKLVWQTVKTSLWIQVPVLKDDKVKMDKWTWAVMCCTYWDETDMFWVQKHNLPEKIILDQYWKIRESWIDNLEWLKVKDARKEIIKILKEKNMVLEEKPIIHAVWTHERDWSPIEIIPVDQRFVSILPLKQKLIELWEKINRHPTYMFKRYKNRVENLHRDRCISRNRHYWVPIPARYSKKTWEIILADISQLPVDPYTDKPLKLPEWHTYDDIIPETDVLDTWFTSWLTPHINNEILKKKWYSDTILPMNLRPHAHDNIRVWTFYSIVQTRFLNKDIPFNDIMVSWFVLAKKWEKISKSKWNAKFTPESLIKTYWADATRYRATWWQLWKDMAFDEWELRNWKKLVTKLRNAFQFIKMQLENVDIATLKNFDIENLQNTDKRIFSKLEKTIKTMDNYLKKFEFWLAKIAFENFFRWDFCDTYLEMVKLRVYKPELFTNWDIKQKSWQYTLFHTYFDIIKLIAPYLPHITEEIYQDYYKDFFEKKSIHITKYPTETINFWNNDDIINNFSAIKTIIELVRRYKTEKQISLWTEVSELIIFWNEEQVKIIKKYIDDIKWVSKAKNIEFKNWNDIQIEIVL